MRYTKCNGLVDLKKLLISFVLGILSHLVHPFLRERFGDNSGPFILLQMERGDDDVLLRGFLLFLPFFVLPLPLPDQLSIHVVALQLTPVADQLPLFGFPKTPEVAHTLRVLD